MKNVKQLLAGVLAISLTAGLAVGCGGDNTSSSGSASSNTSSGGSADSGSTSAGTHKLKLLGPDATMNNDLKFSEREEYPVWQEFQKLLDAKGLQLEYEMVANEQYKTVIQTRMAAANNLPDIASLSELDDTTAINLGRQGILLDVGELTEQYSDGTIRKAIDTLYPFSDGLTVTPDGHKYWFTNLHVKTYNGSDPAPVGLGITIRKDWLDKLSLSAPTTVDELYDALIAFQENDVNGTGAKDEVAVMNPANFSNGIAQCFGLGYAVVNVRGDNLEVVSPWYQDGIKDYITFMKKMADAGVLDISGIGNVGDVATQRKQENKLALTFDYGLESWLATQTGAEGAEYQALMPLKAIDGIEPAAVMEPHTLVWNKYGITKDCKDLEGAIAFFDVVHSDKAIELLTWGIKDDYYEVIDGVNYYKDRTNTKEEAAQRRTRGNPLWGNTVFPIIQAANLEYELVSVPDWKKAYQLDVMTYTPWYTTSNSSFTAIPTEEQTNRLNEINSAIDTYSQELLTKLILGQESLDNWDSFMKQFESLGLPDMVQIYSDLVKSYQEKVNG